MHRLYITLLLMGSWFLHLPAQNFTIEGVSPVGSLNIDGKNAPNPGSDASTVHIPEISLQRTDYALLFATELYSKNSPYKKLNNPIKDALALQKVLEERYGFEVKLVENPSRRDILNTLRSFSGKNYGDHDQLLVYFSGHGIKDSDLGMLVPADAQDHNDCITHADFLSRVNNIDCDHILVLADACYSGLFAQRDIGKRNDPYPKRGSRFYKDKSDEDFLTSQLDETTRLFLTSGTGPVPDGLQGSHSPFMYKILDTFKTEARPGGDLEDGFLEIDELILNTRKIKASEPVDGAFGNNSPGSNFLFILR